jgi:hypothetical protein
LPSKGDSAELGRNCDSEKFVANGATSFDTFGTHLEADFAAVPGRQSRRHART